MGYANRIGYYILIDNILTLLLRISVTLREPASERASERPGQ